MEIESRRISKFKVSILKFALRVFICSYILSSEEVFYFSIICGEFEEQINKYLILYHNR